MSERLCQVTGCGAELSDWLPPEFLVCGRCQARGLIVLRQFQGLAQTPQNISFFALHPAGCFASNLADFVGVSEPTMCLWIKRGKVAAEKVSTVGGPSKTPGCYWWINLPELARMVDLSQNWVKVSQACKGKVAADTYLSFARRGELGEIRETPGGYLAVHRSVLPRLDRIFATRKRAGCRRRRAIPENGNGGISVTRAMSLVPIDLRWRIRAGQLEGGKSNGRWVTTWVGLKEFAEKAVSGRVEIKSPQTLARIRTNLPLLRRRANGKKPL